MKKKQGMSLKVWMDTLKETRRDREEGDKDNEEVRRELTLTLIVMH